MRRRSHSSSSQSSSGRQCSVPIRQTGKSLDLPRLDEHERLEQLVERPEAAGEEHEGLGGLHEHRLARVEVAERQADVAVRVQLLLVRQLDVEADGHASGFLRASVRALHHARPAAGHDREAGERPRACRARAPARTSGRPPPFAPNRTPSRLGSRSTPRSGSPDETRRRSSRRASRCPDRSARGSGRPRSLRHRRSCGICVAAMPRTSTADSPT